MTNKSTVSFRSLFTLFFASTALIAPSWGSAEELAPQLTPPKVVPTIDLQKYAGKWFEIASTRPVFQEDCFCTSAEYSVLSPSEVEVFNSCRKGSPEGELDSVTGVATIPDLNVPAKLKVNFGGPDLPFTNYWIVSLAEDYSYAVVSSALRNPIFILARTSSLPNETKASILDDLSNRGFNTSRLDFGIQAGCLKSNN